MSTRRPDAHRCTRPGPRRPRRRAWSAGLAAVVLLAGACSGGDEADGDAAGPDGTAGQTSGTTVDVAFERTCDQGATQDVEAVPVEGVESDLTVTSFDGTELRVHWFPVEGASADAPAPTVLMGPGWSLGGDTSLDPEANVLFGAASIPGLHDAGYNVLTWDPRGFGESGGEVQINAPDAEGRDVQVLLDLVAGQPEAQTDAEGDPRVGMVGFSYGGGIQLTTAAMDCRVEAIVPGLAWHSLETSLYRTEIVKLGWGAFLADIGGTQGTLDPHIPSAIESAEATGQLGEEDEDWFRGRGPGDAVADITAPTLFVHGTVDTLFTPAEALTNHRILRDAGVPTAMVWFCGGHGACSTHEPSTDQVTEATFAWLDRWVKGDEAVEVPTGLTVVDQDGSWWHVEDPQSSTLAPAGSGSGTLELAEGSGAGPIELPESDDVLSGLVEPITTDPAEVALEVELTVPDGGLVVGAPRVALRYSGTVEEGERPVRIFGQLVDPATDTVVGHQVAPIELVLDGTEQRAEVDLEAIVQHLEPGDRLVLQLVATTVAYATPRLGGEVTFEAIEVSLPLVYDGVRRS